MRCLRQRTNDNRHRKRAGKTWRAAISSQIQPVKARERGKGEFWSSLRHSGSAALSTWWFVCAKDGGWTRGFGLSSKQTVPPGRIGEKQTSGRRKSGTISRHLNFETVIRNLKGETDYSVRGTRQEFLADIEGEI